MEYKDDLYRYLISLTRDPTLSEDLLSETFIRAITSIETFKEQSSIKTWLIGIARNVWLQYLRRRKEVIAYSELSELHSGENIEDNIAVQQAVLRARELLKSKDERSQNIFILRENGVSYAEISDAIGISENSARVIDFRTRKWIKNILTKEGLL